MINLRTQDLKDVIEISHRTLECDSMDSLREETLTLMERSLGARSSIYARFTKKKKRIEITEGTDHGVPDGAMARWCSTYHEADPFMKRFLAQLPTKSNGIILSNEVISHREYVATPFYNEFMKPQSIYHVMIIGLKTDDNEPIGVFGLHRPIHAPAFSAREVAKANLLAPHLKGAFQRVSAREMLQESNWAANTFADQLTNDGVAVIDQELNTVYLSPNAGQILGCKTYLPDDLLAECAIRLSELNANAARPVTFHLNFRGRPLRMEMNVVEGGDGNPRFMLRLDTSPQDIHSKPDLLNQMRKLGLSRREMDVAQLLPLGLTSMQIADKLCISVRTVNNHLRSIYEKTGVHNRTSLIYHLSAGEG